jgi:hypothetical protein
MRHARTHSALTVPLAEAQSEDSSLQLAHVKLSRMAPDGDGCGTVRFVAHQFVIERERFLLLAAAMAAVHCAPPPSQNSPQPARVSAPETAPPVLPIGVAEPAPEPVVEPMVATEKWDVVDEPPATSEQACNNEEGEVLCDFIVSGQFTGPACEGFRGACELLDKGYGYKRRVAAAIARCWESKGRAACQIRVRQRCNREALRSACPDPQFTSYCLDALDRCRQKGQRPDFDLDECVLALSSLEGGNLEWAKSAIGPSREGCKLMFPVY